MKSCPKAIVVVLSVCFCLIILSALPVAGQSRDKGPWCRIQSGGLGIKRAPHEGWPVSRETLTRTEKEES